jgi:preprotein translocase subunit SecA
MFRALTNRIDEEILRWMFLYQPVAAPPPEPLPPDEPLALREPRPRRPRTSPPVGSEAAFADSPGVGGGGFPPPRAMPRNLTFNDPSQMLSGSRSALGAAAEPKEAHGGNDGAVETVRREGKKVGRNDPCPCGSGKKYKKCHGAT